MSQQSVSELVRAVFAAYLAGDRDAMQALLHDDLTFTSPYDDHIGKAAYFERCWPNSVNMRSFQEMKLFESGDEAFLLYQARFEGSELIRNTEFFRARDGRIKDIEVYFGSPAKQANQ